MTLVTSIVLSTLFLTLLLINVNFLYLNSFLHFEQEPLQVQLYSIPLIFSLDNLTAVFCFLTVFLTAVCLFVTWSSPNYASAGFYFSLWFLEFALFHAFSSLNLLLFYIFFEITLVPMLLLIIVWGSRQRRLHATLVFFFYTAVGSIFLLLGLLWLLYISDTAFTPNLSYIRFNFYDQKFLWFLFFLGFAAKVPLVPLHTWLPEAHVEAPTPGSIILAGLLLKIGTFGMLKFMFPFLNQANSSLKPIAFIFAILSIYHASLVALRQIDLKKIIAYSSVAHMGFVILGLFSFNLYGLLGSLFIMFSHGFVASALFFLVGFLYDRYGTKNLLDFGGLVVVNPLFAVALFLFSLANLSFPGTSNFVGEAFVLLGLTEVDAFSSLLATFSIVLTASYTIWAFNRISFGALNKKLAGFSDLNKLEFLTFVSFLFLTLLFGLRPNLFFHGIDFVPFFYLSL